MKNRKKEEIGIKVAKPLYGKRDYYFHADEDFREDREWAKTKLNAVIRSSEQAKVYQ
jgi:hypothetical protein